MQSEMLSPHFPFWMIDIVHLKHSEVLSPHSPFWMVGIVHLKQSEMLSPHSPFWMIGIFHLKHSEVLPTHSPVLDDWYSSSGLQTSILKMFMSTKPYFLIYNIY